jgi:hypothetical protein
MNDRQVGENCVFRENDGDKSKQTADGKLHCHQNIYKIKTNLHGVSFFPSCLTKLMKSVLQFLNLLYIIGLKSVF